MYIARDAKHNELGRFDTIDEAMAQFATAAFHASSANTYDVYNAEGKRERGTIWTVYFNFGSRPDVVGTIKRPNTIDSAIDTTASRPAQFR